MEEYTGITYGESWNEEWNHLIPAAIEIIHQILSIPQNVRAVPVAYGVPMELLAQLEQLLRQYMHNTEIAVTMRLSTILKTIKQPL